MQPTSAQLVLLALSVAVFVAGGLASLWRIRGERPGLRAAARVCLYLGTALSLAVIVWHSAARGQWLPLTDNFDALIWLAALLAGFVIYVQQVRPLVGLEWFVMPVVVLLLLAAGFFGRVEYHSYQPVLRDVWLWLHRATSYAGTMAFAVAAAGGAMYMLVSRRLRSKSGGVRMGSLERLEHLMMVSVTLGFALLSMGLVTGLARMREGNVQSPAAKLWLGCLAWLVYAVVMHAPINPRFRGRRAAVLSVLGFALVVGALVAVQFMPGGEG